MSRDGKPITSEQIKKASPTFCYQCGCTDRIGTNSNRWVYLSPAGDWQAWFWYSHDCSWTRTERRNTLRLWQNPGKHLNITTKTAIKDDVQTHTHTWWSKCCVSYRAAGWVWRRWWRCWRPLLTLLPVWSACPETRRSGCHSWSVCKWYVTMSSTRF